MSEVMAGPVLAGRIIEVKAANVAEANPADELVHCDDCGSDEVYRIFRKGFFEERIYPLGGFYPWRCRGCGLRLMLRRRDLASKPDGTE